MPSSLNFVIYNIPKIFNESDIYDAVVEKDICKVLKVILTIGRTKNSAIVMVDYWYRGTKNFRNSLLKGEHIDIIMIGLYRLRAFEYTPHEKKENTTNISTTIIDYNSNGYAAKTFIIECENEYFMHNTQSMGFEEGDPCQKSSLKTQNKVQKMNETDYASGALKRKVRFTLP
jgi:hypothetical protein